MKAPFPTAAAGRDGTLSANPELAFPVPSLRRVTSCAPTERPPALRAKVVEVDPPGGGRIWPTSPPGERRERSARCRTRPTGRRTRTAMQIRLEIRCSTTTSEWTSRAESRSRRAILRGSGREPTTTAGGRTTETGRHGGAAAIPRAARSSTTATARSGIRSARRSRRSWASFAVSAAAAIATIAAGTAARQRGAQRGRRPRPRNKASRYSRRFQPGAGRGQLVHDELNGNCDTCRRSRETVPEQRRGRVAAVLGDHRRQPDRGAQAACGAEQRGSRATSGPTRAHSPGGLQDKLVETGHRRYSSTSIRNLLSGGARRFEVVKLRSCGPIDPLRSARHG